MARKRDEIQYVRYYSVGSAAQKVELLPKKGSLPKPRAKKERLPIIRVDGLAVLGIVVSVVMLICMLIGFAQVNAADARLRQERAHVAVLQARNENLHEQYEHGYDLNEVRLAAESMGLVPKDQVQHITISVPEPMVEEESTWWESVWEDICSLFA